MSKYEETRISQISLQHVFQLISAVEMTFAYPKVKDAMAFTNVRMAPTKLDVQVCIVFMDTTETGSNVITTDLIRLVAKNVPHSYTTKLN